MPMAGTRENFRDVQMFETLVMQTWWGSPHVLVQWVWPFNGSLHSGQTVKGQNRGLVR